MFGHPGRTDSSGGHTCRTNCEKWGLKNGEYHYHSGGGNSSSSSSGGSSSTGATTPKPDYTQADVDEGHEAGKEKGYEDGYAGRKLTVEINSKNKSYQKGYTSGYEAGYAEGVEKIREEDTKKGKEAGKTNGKTAARNGEAIEVTANHSKSEDWNHAYAMAFSEAYEKEEFIIQLEKNGFDFGYTLEEINYPKDIEDEDDLKEIYQTFYNKGYKKRMEEEESKYFDLGYKFGYQLADRNSTDIDERFLISYDKGYKKGVDTIKNETLEKGYHLAFAKMNYEEPEDIKDDTLLEWLLEGYESNRVAKEIKESGFQYGYENSNYYIPEEFKEIDESIALYDQLFYVGQKAKKEETRKNIMIAGGVGITGLSLGGYYVYRKKKRS